MKKILIISQGDVGAHFIQRVNQTYTSENMYYIVESKARKYTDINHARFKFYEFDSTSLYKLSNLLKMDFLQVFIAMDSLIDVENTIKNIRTMKSKIRIIVLDQWKMEIEDSNIISVNTNEILSSRLLDYLPNVPVIAQNVGLGEGEIMEVMVPFGSSFVYRHIGVIEQKNWRIVAIYRDRKLVMPSRRRMIQPNDLLVLIGDPAVLKSVYRAIKRELGQFPEPFGSNLYLYIDMNVVNLNTLEEFVKHAIFVNQQFTNDLIIKIVNPGNIYVMRQIKNLQTTNVIVNIEYDSVDLNEKFFKDIKYYRVGLIIASQETFYSHQLRTMFYEAHVPVLKIANKSFSKLKDIALILSDNRDLEKISANVFDIAEQMGLNVELYNYLNEHQKGKEQVIEHYYNLSTIFSKSIKVFKENENPIRILKQKENFIQILPFTQKLTSKRILSTFSTDNELLYHKLDEYHQIFIPVQL